MYKDLRMNFCLPEMILEHNDNRNETLSVEE